jgi:cytochrome P450
VEDVLEGFDCVNAIHQEQQHSWQVFGYAEVERILSNPRAFSSDFSGIMPGRDFDLFANAHSCSSADPRQRRVRTIMRSYLVRSRMPLRFGW